MNFKVEVTKRFEKDIQSLENEQQKQILKASLKLENDPFGFNRNQNIVKLKGYKNEYRLRVGDFKIRFEINTRSKTVILLTVAHRRESYR